jgi:hypothetical protein
MKQAVGTNAATALGTAVAEARVRLAAKAERQAIDAKKVAASTEIEFSKADFDAEPLPLTPKFDPDSSAAPTLRLKPAPPTVPANPPVKKK